MRKSSKKKAKKNDAVDEGSLLSTHVTNTVIEDFNELKAIVNTLWNAAQGPTEIENVHVATILSLAVDRLRNMEEPLLNQF